MLFNEKQPSMEHNLLWTMNFDGGQPFMKDDLPWKTTFDERGPFISWTLMEDGPSMKDHIGGKSLLMDDDVWWKMTFDGRHPLIEENFEFSLFLGLNSFWGLLKLLTFIAQSVNLSKMR